MQRLRFWLYHRLAPNRELCPGCGRDVPLPFCVDGIAHCDECNRVVLDLLGAGRRARRKYGV